MCSCLHAKICINLSASAFSHDFSALKSIGKSVCIYCQIKEMICVCKVHNMQLWHFLPTIPGHYLRHLGQMLQNNNKSSQQECIAQGPLVTVPTQNPMMNYEKF